MHVAFDAVMLSAYLHPAAKYPYPVADVSARVDVLIEELEAAGAKIIIATPDKKAGSESRWQVAKVDRQLVAIAKVNGVVCI